MTRIEIYVIWGVYNLHLTPAHNWMNELIRDWTQEFDQALNTSTLWPVWLPKAACYSPCVRWSRGGASVRSDSGILVWVIGWVCVRGCVGIEFLKGVWLGENCVSLLGR